MKRLPDELANRIDRLELECDPDQLTAHPRNFRRHPNKQRDALRASITKHGWVAPALATMNGTVIDGHARVEEALSAGVTVPVLFVDMDEDEAGDMILRLDPISAMAGYDSDVLADLLADQVWEDGEQGLEALLAGMVEELPDSDDGGFEPERYEVVVECESEIDAQQLAETLVEQDYRAIARTV